MNAENFDDEQQMRNKMLESLNEPNSDSRQTKAIQVIGAMVNHASFLLDRNDQEMSGFMESYIIRRQEEKEDQQLAQKTLSKWVKTPLKMNDPDKRPLLTSNELPQN